MHQVLCAGTCHMRSKVIRRHMPHVVWQTQANAIDLMIPLSPMGRLVSHLQKHSKGLRKG